MDDVNLSVGAAEVQSAVTTSMRSRAAAHYAALTGWLPSQAGIEEDRAFDAHVFAAILAIGAAESGALGLRVGLRDGDLRAVMARWFPQERPPGPSFPAEDEDDDDEVGMLRALLLANRTVANDDSRWLAAMIARRAMERNHLWEDLGLRNRGELSRMLMRHFAPLARRNVHNMRWKRFFYRTLCEDDGLVMCTTPVCASCSDFDLCFGREDGESRMAYSRRRAMTSATQELWTGHVDR